MIYEEFGSKSIYERTETVLECLVLNCIEQQNFARKSGYKSSIGPLNNWISEWCTIKVGCPRRTGLTTSMLSVGTCYFENPLFVFPNNHRSKDFKRLSKEEISTTSIDKLTDFCRGCYFDAIFVEYPENHQLRNIYNIAELMIDKKEDDPFVLALFQQNSPITKFSKEE